MIMTTDDAPRRPRRTAKLLYLSIVFGLGLTAFAALVAHGADDQVTERIALASEPATHYSLGLAQEEVIFFLVDSEQSSALFESASAGEEIGALIYTHIFVLDSDQALADTNTFFDEAAPELASVNAAVRIIDLRGHY